MIVPARLLISPFCLDLGHLRITGSITRTLSAQSEFDVPRGRKCRGSMVTRLILLTALATGQLSDLDAFFPDLLMTEANGPPSMCGLSASDTEGLAKVVRATPRFAKADVRSDAFEVYDTADRMQEFVITMESNPAHPAVACREIRQENGDLRLNRYMNCSGSREACNRLFLDFRALDSGLKGVPADNALSLPATGLAKPGTQ